MTRAFSRLVACALLSFARGGTASARADDGPYLKDGETVVFLGDSITQAGGYVEHIEAYLATGYPEKTFHIVYAGLSSETVSGTSEPDHDPRRPCVHDRFTRDVVPRQPNVVVACYGMNDGNYHPFDAERFEKFQRGVKKLVERVRTETKARLVLVTPPPFDPYRRQVSDPDATHYGYKFPAVEYDETLRRYSEWLVSLRAEGIFVVDVHASLDEALRRRRESKASFYLSGDGVHPGPLGHWLMARTILEAWNARPPADAPQDPLSVQVLDLVRQKRKDPSRADAITARIRELCGARVEGAKRDPGTAEGISSMLGVNIHFTGAPARDLDLIRDAGFGWIRMDFTWQAIEREKGAYRFDEYDALLEGLSSRGLRPIFILDYSNRIHEEAQSVRTQTGREAFARFAAASASRYAGRGVRWEVWNEPNLDQFWKPGPSADDYAALLIAASKAIRAADPSATILAPASSGFPWPFLERIFEKGVLAHVDEVSVHPYRGTRPETVRDDFARLRDLIAKHTPAGKAPPPIVSGEWGYSTVHYGGVPIAEDLQAAYLSRELLTNLSERIPLSIWYDWANDGTNPKETEQNFGVVTSDRRPKPAYVAMKTLADALRGLRFDRALEAAPGDHFLVFRGTGKEVVAAWTESDPHAGAIELSDGFRDLELNGRPQYADLPPGTTVIAAYGITVDLLAQRIRVHSHRDGGGERRANLTVEIGLGKLRTNVGLEVKLGSSEESHEFPVTWSAASPIPATAVLRDAADGRVLASAPVRSYLPVKAFHGAALAKETSTRFSAVLDGDAKVAGEAAIYGSAWQDGTRKPEKTLVVEYRFGKGHKFVRLDPAKGLEAIPGKPIAVSVWVKSDGSGDTLRCRYRDARGETFQPTAGALSWKGWRQVALELDGTGASSWGAGADRRVDYPIVWESLLLVDSTREEHTASIEIASPILVYPTE